MKNYHLKGGKHFGSRTKILRKLIFGTFTSAIYQNQHSTLVCVATSIGNLLRYNTFLQHRVIRTLCILDCALKLKMRNEAIILTKVLQKFRNITFAGGWIPNLQRVVFGVSYHIYFLLKINGHL